MVGPISSHEFIMSHKWDKVFKNGSGKICERCLFKQTISLKICEGDLPYFAVVPLFFWFYVALRNFPERHPLQ